MVNIIYISQFYIVKAYIVILESKLRFAFSEWALLWYDVKSHFSKVLALSSYLSNLKCYSTYTIKFSILNIIPRRWKSNSYVGFFLSKSFNSLGVLMKKYWRIMTTKWINSKVRFMWFHTRVFLGLGWEF